MSALGGSRHCGWPHSTDILQKVMIVRVLGLIGLFAGNASQATLKDSGIPEEDYAFLSVASGPCATPMRASTDAASRAACSRMTEPRRYRGTWSVDFEGSFFTPRGRPNCLVSEADHCVELAGKVLPWPSRWACPRVFEVEFIGRRNAQPNFYDGPPYKIVVDELISVKRLPDPPHEPDECDANAP